MAKPNQVILIIPGASLLETSYDEHIGIITVRCPGCGALNQQRAAAGTVNFRPLVHEEDCAVLAKIRQAEARMGEADTN